MFGRREKYVGAFCLAKILFGRCARSGIRPRNVLHFTLLSEPDRWNDRRASVGKPPMIEIVRRAYELWEQAGKPDGKDQEFYHQAERELTEAAPDKTDQKQARK
jgi:hypothetical protein